MKEHKTKEQLEAAQKETERKILDDLRVILEKPEGKRTFEQILTDCKVMHPSFTGNSQTYFLEGQRNTGLKLMDRIARAGFEVVFVNIDGETVIKIDEPNKRRK